MKYKTLNENSASDTIEAIQKWVDKNLTGTAFQKRIFVIDEQHVRINTVNLITYLDEFPYRFVDVSNIIINKPESLKSFKNFPVSTKDSLSISFNSSQHTNITLNFRDLPIYPEVGNLNFTFHSISSIQIKHLSKFDNLQSVRMLFCLEPDIYNFETYDIRVSEFDIVPSRRFKNLSSFMTNKKMLIEHFFIDDAEVYSELEINALNSIFLKYNNAPRLNFFDREEHAMDFVVDIIDAGFEDDV